MRKILKLCKAAKRGCPSAATELAAKFKMKVYTDEELRVLNMVLFGNMKLKPTDREGLLEIQHPVYLRVVGNHEWVAVKENNGFRNLFDLATWRQHVKSI